MGYRSIGDADTGYEQAISWPLVTDRRVRGGKSRWAAVATQVLRREGTLGPIGARARLGSHDEFCARGQSYLQDGLQWGGGAAQR
jgi:hypothetical protein